MSSDPRPPRLRFDPNGLPEISMPTAITSLLLLALVFVPDALAGQEGGLAAQSLRPYGHVFIAYALAWALVFGWVISLARRWGRVQEELEDGGPGDG